jgi:hypothetical protein
MRKLTTATIGAACLAFGAGGATLYTHAANDVLTGIGRGKLPKTCSLYRRERCRRGSECSIRY